VYTTYSHSTVSFEMFFYFLLVTSDMSNMPIIVSLLLLFSYLGKEEVDTPLFVDPSEEVVNTVFEEVADTSGYHHWYIDMNYGENWCWKHNVQEVVTPFIRIADLNKIKLD